MAKANSWTGRRVSFRNRRRNLRLEVFEKRHMMAADMLVAAATLDAGETSGDESLVVAAATAGNDASGVPEGSQSLRATTSAQQSGPSALLAVDAPLGVSATNVIDGNEAPVGLADSPLVQPELESATSAAIDLALADFSGHRLDHDISAELSRSGLADDNDASFGIFGPDYDKVKTADDFDKIRRTKYDKYVVERELNKKSHEDACKVIDIDADGDFAEACKRVYEASKKK